MVTRAKDKADDTQYGESRQFEMKNKWKFNMDMKHINKFVLAGSHREYRRWCHDKFKWSPQEAAKIGIHYVSDMFSLAGIGRMGVDYELVFVGTWAENKAYQKDGVRVLMNEHFAKAKHGESHMVDFTKDGRWILNDDPVLGKHVEPEEIEEQEEIPFNFMEALRAL